MSIRERIEAQLEEVNPEALFADGFDDALIGVAFRAGGDLPPLVCYDRGMCIKILMDRDGMEEEEAEEFFEFNTMGAWMGKHTPLFIDVET